MHHRALAVILAIAVVVFGWLLFIGLPRWARLEAAPTTRIRRGGITSPPPVSPLPHEKSPQRLFYVSDDGLTLAGTPREVPSPTASHRRHAPSSKRSWRPRRAAVVGDPGRDQAARRVRDRARRCLRRSLGRGQRPSTAGGALDELLTIYTIVDALDRQSAGHHARPDPDRREGSRHARRPRRPAASVGEKPSMGSS